MVTPFTYYDLLEAFAEPGCAICHLLLRDADRMLDTMLYEYVNDSEVRQAFRTRRGLCNEHSWQLAQQGGNLLGVVLLYTGVMDEALTLLQQAAPSSEGSRNRLRRPTGAATHQQAQALAANLKPTRKCMICERLATAETQYLKMLGQYMLDEKLVQAYQDSEGLCLSHFRLALTTTHDVESIGMMITLQQAIWSKIYADLKEFREKSDYRRIQDEKGDERDSWRRAINSMAGKKGIFGLDPR
ncbi:MAG: hypothetical protein JXN59_00240 [Anaerolineae bacterium]|nr:hypothetical protein [Anaerolineae bacterium]